ncbi:MAG TPA: hypothetical protein VJ782_08940 [Aeromicrobium sp.]|nr:hypothetical protein [Aeromicrobium sp.]
MRVAVMLLIGAIYGVLLRGWMRFVSTDPEFSWSGTGYIVGIFAVLGLMAGLVDLGRRRGWRAKLLATRAVGGVLTVGCFMAAGVAMFPTIVPAALGVARTDWWKPLRLGLVGFAAVVACVVVLGMGELSLPRRSLALAMYVALCAVEVTLLSRILAPSLPPGSISDAPVALRLLLVGLPLLVVFALVITAVGIPAG